MSNIAPSLLQNRLQNGPQWPCKFAGITNALGGLARQGRPDGLADQPASSLLSLDYIQQRITQGDVMKEESFRVRIETFNHPLLLLNLCR